jgi:hypothetical protein
MMKVINLISLLLGPIILQMSLMTDTLTFNPSLVVIVAVIGMVALLGLALWYSKRETVIFKEEKEQKTKKKSK